MSHGIVKPIDRVFSIESPEWHKLAEVVPTIDDITISPLLFPIVTGTVTVDVDGKQVTMGNHKALVADMRHRPDLAGTENEFVPLHIPKKSYEPIDNRMVWDAMQKSLKDCGAKVMSAGTLEAGKKFFISADIGHAENMICGQKYLMYLNFITSHDGTLGMSCNDSTIKIVCMNTLRWSLEAAGETGFKVYHTKNSSTEMKNMPELLNHVLLGREYFKESMEKLEATPVKRETAKEIIAGYFATQQNVKEFATRSLNAVEEIHSLFIAGKGNRGETLADVLNGATDYWTNGNGTGRNAGQLEKLYKGNFGTAATHKTRFCDMLLDSDKLETAREKGAIALGNSKE